MQTIRRRAWFPQVDTLICVDADSYCADIESWWTMVEEIKVSIPAGFGVPRLPPMDRDSVAADSHLRVAK